VALKDTIDGSEQPQRPHNLVALNGTITGSKNCEYSKVINMKIIGSFRVRHVPKYGTVLSHFQ